MQHFWANFWGKKRVEKFSDLCTEQFLNKTNLKMLDTTSLIVISFALLKVREKNCHFGKALAQCLTSSISSFLIFLRLAHKHQVETIICLARSHQSDELDESSKKRSAFTQRSCKNGVRYVYQAYDAPWLKKLRGRFFSGDTSDSPKRENPKDW